MHLNIEKDIEILQIVTVPHNAYEVRKKLLDRHYYSISLDLQRLESLGLVKVVKEEKWHKGKRRWYQTTPNGNKVIYAFKNNKEVKT